MAKMHAGGAGSSNIRALQGLTGISKHLTVLNIIYGEY